jgi:signal peptidase II
MIFILAAILGVGILVFIDQIIKIWAVNVLKPAVAMDFISIGGKEILGFRYAENTGAAFSSFSNGGIFLTIIITLILIGVAFYALTDKNKTFFKSLLFVMVIAGGVGNLVDRIKQGFVVDYIEVRFIDFAIFNFADILIVVGAIMLFIYFFIEEMRSDKKRAMRLRAEIRRKQSEDR